MKHLLFLLSCLVLLSAYEPAVLAQTPAEEDFSALQQAVFDEVNAHRLSKRLKLLQLHPMITAEALKHSRDMGSRKIQFGHSGFDDRMDRIMDNIARANASAENVAFGRFTAQEVVRRWLQSPGHRKNIEGNFNLTGVGIIRGKDGYPYFTQIFINQATP